MVKLLGGPDREEHAQVKQKALESAWMSISKSKGSRDYPAIERNLLRLLRVKRDGLRFINDDDPENRRVLPYLEMSNDVQLVPTMPAIDLADIDTVEIEPVNGKSDEKCSNKSLITSKSSA